MKREKGRGREVGSWDNNTEARLAGLTTCLLFRRNGGHCDFGKGEKLEGKGR